MATRAAAGFLVGGPFGALYATMSGGLFDHAVGVASAAPGAISDLFTGLF